VNNPRIVINRINRGSRIYLQLSLLRMCCQLPNLPSEEFDFLSDSICILVKKLAPDLYRAIHTILVSWVFDSLGEWL